MTDVLHTLARIVVSTILVYYLVEAVLDMGLGMLRTVYPSRVPRSRQPQLDIAFKALVRQGLLRSKLLGVLTALQVSAWPVLFSLNRVHRARANNVQFGAKVALRPIDRRVAIFNLGLVIVVIVLAKADIIWHPLINPIVILILIGTAARHLSYMFGGLPERLRASRYNPYASFLVIAVCDACTLIGTVAVLYYSTAASEVSPTTLRSTALGIFKFEELIDTLGQRPSQLIIAMLGLLYYSELAKSATTFKQFERTDQDVRRIATALVMTGAYGEARVWIEKEQQRSADSFAIRAGIELGCDNFEEATDYMRRNRRAAGEDESSDSMLLHLWAITAWVPLDPAARLTLVERCIALDASDAVIAMEIAETVGLFRVPPEKVTAALLARCPEQRYPLARAFLMLQNDDPHEASQILERAKPGLEIEELVRLNLICVMAALDSHGTTETRRDLINRWHADYFPDVYDLVKSLGKEWRYLAMLSLLALQQVVSLTNPGVAAEIKQLALEAVNDKERVERWANVQRQVMAG
jgi:hypothetical protein